LGLGTRRLRSALSTLGIAIGVGAIVAVLGLSQSSSAGLRREISALGTNLLTVGPGQTPEGTQGQLPETAPAMIGRIAPVRTVEDTGQVPVDVYRNPFIPTVESNALAVEATSLGLLSTVGTGMAFGAWLNRATAQEPVVVLGAAAATRLGIDRVFPGERVWLGDHWFYVSGALRPAPLTPEIDSSVLIGYPAAERYLGFNGHPTEVYVRTAPSQVNAVDGVLAATANPHHPDEVAVSQPSAALVAEADASATLDSLLLGLGGVALLVGAIGVANVMAIAVLERRSEIGLRRALGATRADIAAQFLAESVLLSLVGGAAGIVLGAGATAVYASTRGWPVVVPATAWAGSIGLTLVVGVVAGILPAVRAARMSPTRALWSI
jgi:putative ABC transport system permease protein